MAILKNKEPLTTDDPRWAAGYRQEQDVAFYLRRAFKDDENILILNDYRFTHNGETAQIDHLVVHRAGFIIIESKSIYGEVKVNALGEWSRSYKGQWSGMPSPIIQAEMQRDLLKAFLGDHVDKFLGKLLGIQMKVARREWDVLCTVSNNCILHRNTMPDEIGVKVVKSESVAEQVKKIGAYSRLSAAVSSKPYFIVKEFQRLGEFLMQTSAGSEEPIAEPQHYINSVGEQALSSQVASMPNEVSEPAVVHEENTVIGLRCKGCGSDDGLNACSGKYGYYVKCGHCGANTSMRINCPTCGSNKVKVSKRGNEYWLSCHCAMFEKLYEQR
ncbi:nuclease-related domain-containing protein [Oceanisphaera sediminis]|uniref:Nuclease-related domain-containing protein n=1 Tax=Oceanisphaera sediminis TaxID=981381 RepID=A0ABP7EPR6_9GAMM